MKKYWSTLDKIIIILLFLCQMTFSSRRVDDIQQGLFSMGNIVRVIVAPTCMGLCFLYFLKNGISIKNIPKNLKYIIAYWIIGAISFINISSKWFSYSILKYIEYSVMIVVIVYFSTRLVKDKILAKEMFNVAIRFFELLLLSVLIGLIIDPQKALYAETEFSELRNSVIPFVLRGHLITLSATMVGYISGILLFVYSVDFIDGRKRNRVNILKMIIFLGCFFVAQSRMAWITFVIAFSWYMFIVKKNNIFKIFIINIVIVCVILFNDKIIRVILRGQEVDSFVSVTGRSKWWTFAIETFKNTDILKKIFGHGFGSGEKVVVSQISSVMGTMDSDYFGALTSVGIIGLIFMILFIVDTAYKILIYSNYINDIDDIDDRELLIKVSGIGIIILGGTFTVTSLGLLNYRLVLLVICSFTIDYFCRMIKLKRSK